MGPSNSRAFRSSFMVLWRWTSALCGLGGALIYGTAWFMGRPISGPPTIALSLLLGILFAVAVVLMPVYVTPEGVRCYNFWGLYRTVGWAEMGEIRRQSVLGLRYLTVAPPDGAWPIYVPLYLSDMPEFLAAVRKHAGDAHPLVAALERYRG